MRFEFIADEHIKVKTFLKKHEVSKGLLSKIKFRGGSILVNDRPQNATYLLDIGDRVTIDIPAEEGFETLEAIDRPLDILFEDDHFLVLNKPYGVASIPSVNHSNTIANFIKGYYVKQEYENQQVHIVTRLDRDTSGLMLFAKHGYAHARLDKQLQRKSIEKRYFALVKGNGDLEPEGEIIAPIARCGLHYHEKGCQGWKIRPYLLQSCSVFWRYSPDRYSIAYWANPSDQSAFFSYRFSLVGRRSLWRQPRRWDSTTGLALPFLIILSSFLGASARA